MSLLTENYNKEFKREKILRILVGFATILIVVLLAGLVFMLPSYFVLVFSKDDILRRLKAAEEVFDKKEFKSLEREITAINSQISIFEKNENRRREFAQLLRKIAANTPSGAKIVFMNLDKNEEGLYTLTLQGEAAERGTFLRYVEKLESFNEFASIDSPVDNLLKETKTAFVLKIKIKPDAYGYAK